MQQGSGEYTLIDLPETSQSAEDQTDGIIAVFMDADHTALTLHTYGCGRFDWEVPWIRNIRAFPEQQAFIDSIRQHAVFGSITFNVNRKRISGTYKELGFKRGEYYLHTEFINPEDYPNMGKNKHIAECLLQHYATENATPIVKVIVMDDDPRNIKNLKNFKNYVMSTQPYCDNKLICEVEIIGILVPKPAEQCHIEHQFQKKIRTPIFKMETVCINGELQDINFTQEKFWSRSAFVNKLNEVERMVIEHGLKHPLPEKYRPKKKDVSKKPVSQRLRLTASFGQPRTTASELTKEVADIKLQSSL